MGDYRVEIEGDDKLIDALLSNKNLKQVKAIVKSSTINVARGSQQLVPVGWGKDTRSTQSPQKAIVVVR